MNRFEHRAQPPAFLRRRCDRVRGGRIGSAARRARFGDGGGGRGDLVRGGGRGIVPRAAGRSRHQGCALRCGRGSRHARDAAGRVVGRRDAGRARGGLRQRGLFRWRRAAVADVRAAGFSRRSAARGFYAARGRRAARRAAGECRRTRRSAGGRRSERRRGGWISGLRRQAFFAGLHVAAVRGVACARIRGAGSGGCCRGRACRRPSAVLRGAGARFLAPHSQAGDARGADGARRVLGG